MELHPVVLIGFMGSGKTSVARALARHLQRDVVDLDEAIEARSGCSIADLFQRDGEEVFREFEAVALRDALIGPAVISCGGGVVTRPENREALRRAAADGAVIVYLRAEPLELAQRIRRQPGKRPLIDGDSQLDDERTVARVQELLVERAPHYEACANLIMDTDHKSPGELAGDLYAMLTARPIGAD